MLKFSARAVAAAAAAFCFAFGTASQARIVTDHLDRNVDVPDTVNRVVVTNIFPYASVAAVYLGGAEKLVGIHPVSMSAAKNGLLGSIYPEILKADTSFMKGNSLNIEALLDLKPDVVFVNAGDKPLIAQLENAGVPAVAVSTSKWDYDVLKTYDNWIALLGEIFPDKAKSDKAARYSKNMFDLVQSRVKDIPDNQRKNVLFIFQYDAKRLVTSGRHFFGQYWADATGARNVAQDIQSKNSNAIINLEQVYAWNPDVVFVTNFTPVIPQDIYDGKINDWSSVKAVKNKQVYKLPLGIYRSYTPSADTPMTLLWMAKTLYPDRFADIDVNAEIKKYYKDLYAVDLTEAQIKSIFDPDANRSSGFTGRAGVR